MPETLSVHEARTHLSRLLERVERGEEIVIARAGKPVARLVPVDSAPQRHRVFDGMAGRIHFAADYEDSDVGVAALFDAASPE